MMYTTAFETWYERRTKACHAWTAEHWGVRRCLVCGRCGLGPSCSGVACGWFGLAELPDA
jgi:hypothetical protein